MNPTLEALLPKVDEQAATYARLVAYYEGRQPLAYLSPETRQSLRNRLASVSVNIPRLLVDSLAERLRVTGFSDPDVWPLWAANGLDALHGTAHRESLMLGDAYALCWARPDGRAKVTIESATNMAVSVDPGTREILAGLKKWESPQGTHAVTYEADVIRHYLAPSTGATSGFREVAAVANPFGVPPLVRFRNGDRLTTAGLSEMLDCLPLVDALTKIVTDMLVASEYTARPRRWATGIELEEDEDGNAVNPIPEGDRAMISENDGAKFGQLGGSDLLGYENAVGVLMRLISAVTGLPEHLLGIGGDNPTSADSIRASEAALTARAEARQKTLGKGWDDVARFLLAIDRKSDLGAVGQVRTEWADAATRSVAQEADATVKLVQAGILPVAYALRKLGYSEAEIVAIRAAKRAEALDTVGTDLDALLS